MLTYTFRTYKNEAISVGYLFPEETKIYKTSIVSEIKSYGKDSNVYELDNGKALADIFYGGSSLLYSSRAIFEEIDGKVVFLRLPESHQLIGFQLLDAEELPLVDSMISQSLGKSCEGETFLLSTGQVYTRDEYKMHGYIFMSVEEINLYCTEWVNKDPLQVIVAVTPFR